MFASTRPGLAIAPGHGQQHPLVRRLLIVGLSVLLAAAPVLALSSIVTAAEASPPQQAHVLTIGGAIDAGLARYVARVVRGAAEAHAALLVVIDSTGGTVDAALEIKDALLGFAGPTVAFVSGRAWSAAALVAMAAETLVMAPGSSIGAAEPIPLTAKTLSAVRAEFTATAEARGRDPQLAAAMVDSAIEIPGVVARDQLLSLTAGRAVELGMADALGTAAAEALAAAGLGGIQTLDRPMTPAESVARLVTHPAVAPVLLTVALVSLVIEVFSAGFGAAGVIGIVSLGLFFGGHLIAGVGGWEITALFLLGIGLLAVEAFIPGFGIFGIGGIAAMGASVYLASRNSAEAMRSLVIALVASAGLSVLLIRSGARRGWFKRLTLGQSLRAEQGFIAREQPKEMIGRTGVAITALRPAGKARFGDTLLDVVSDGMFVTAGTPVTVIRVEGVQIVVSQAAGNPGGLN